MNRPKKSWRWLAVLLVIGLLAGNMYLLGSQGDDALPESDEPVTQTSGTVIDNETTELSFSDAPTVTPTDMVVTTSDVPGTAIDTAVTSPSDTVTVTGSDVVTVSHSDTVTPADTVVVTPVEPDENSELRQSLRQLDIGSGIQADGMSTGSVQTPAVELGISHCDVYCRDFYQIIPLCGQSLKWTSSDEETATVNQNGLVETLKAGSVTITATDAAGNSDSCVINVIKVAYITIDDTPTEFTPKLLDILDEYGVKATFFMNADPDEAQQYIEIYKRGHTFALHGYRHATSYKNGDAFIENMEKSRQFIMETTGCDSVDKLVRFPTGSKGMKNYREILEYIQLKGYKAYDWTTEFHDYYYHSKKGCLEYFKTYLTHDRDIVLFHPREWSVEALPEALEYIISKGYTMAPITEDTMQYNFYNFYAE